MKFKGILMIAMTAVVVNLGAQELRYLDVQTDAPEWVKLMYSDSPNPGEVIEAYQQYFDSHPFTKSKHTQYYKRWIRSLSRDLPTNGLSRVDKVYLRSRELEQTRDRSDDAGWTSLGPWDWDHEAEDRSYAPGAAHVYAVAQSVIDADVLYAATATAGIWRTDDGGESWFCITQDRILNGSTTLAINIADDDVVFAEMHQNVFKTTNGGDSWEPTGNGAFQALEFNSKDIVSHPELANEAWLCSDAGLYRTTNAGATWSQILSGDYLELEFHPTNRDTIYAVRVVGEATEFLRSVNGGTSFTVQSNGWPDPFTPDGEEQRRTEIAVSPAQPNLVIALATGAANGGSGLYGIYKSIDAGATWTFTCCGPQPAGVPSETNMNLMGWSDLGLDDGGQYYYDLALDISPTNADSIFVGGVNFWISGDGGVTFVCPAKWSHSYKPGYVHADIHDIRYMPITKQIWVAGDGGIFRSTDNAASFNRRMTGIAGTDFWGFGVGMRDGDVMLGGTYHNGTLLKDNDVYENGWVSTDGGDNYRGFVHPTQERQVFSDYNIKALSGDRTVSNATRGFSNKPNASYVTGQSSDILFHPHYWHTWYSGSGTSLWLTEDDGYTFSEVHDFGVDVAAAAICTSDPQTICVTTFPGWWDTKHIWITHDGGESWTDITPSEAFLNGNTWVPYDVAISAVDPNRIWAARTSMYSGTNLGGVEVISSDDGGQTWNNITDDLPLDEACTGIEHHAGSTSGLYLGTRRAVYYRSENTTGWELYSLGLPASTNTTRLAMHYGQKKVRTGTNRSVWERDTYENFKPVASPSSAVSRITCLQDTTYFRDNSAIPDSNITWLWSFPGGVPTTSELRDPKVVYTTPGQYDVSLIVTTPFGADTTAVMNMIMATDECGVDGKPGRAMSCVANPDHAIASGFTETVDSFTVTSWVRPSGIQNDYAAVVMNDGETGGLNFREGNNTLGYHWPGGQWFWDSGLEVPADKWSHVAMVVTPSQVRLYLNGVEAIHNIATQPIALTTLRIGSYKGWGDRNYEGLIDEVCIYDRALSTDEIRSRRHLTLIPDNEPGLIAYYQFNEQSGPVFDKVSQRNAVLNGLATRLRSRAPLGRGVSEMKTINSAGTFSYAEANCTLEFYPSSQTPNGDLWMTRLSLTPDTVDGNYQTLHNGYWIANNYGANEIISNFDLTLDSIGFISEVMATGGLIEPLFVGREANSEVVGWETIGKTPQLGAGMGGSLDAFGIGGFTPGQFIALRQSFPEGIGRIRVNLADTLGSRPGAGSLGFDLNNARDLGLGLPIVNAELRAAKDDVSTGSIAYDEDTESLFYYDGVNWSFIEMDLIDADTQSEEGETTGAVFIDSVGVQTGALLTLGRDGFFIPGLTSDSTALTVEYPAEGSIVYLTEHQSPAVYDGSSWRLFNVTNTSALEGDGISDPTLPGFLIGESSKDKNARLEVAPGSLVLGLPVVPHGEVATPGEGVIVYDPDLRAVCVYTGQNWTQVVFK